DDFQDFRGRGLLLQRLGKLACARLYFLEQTHVLDGDHRLVGEGSGQLDLFVGEWQRGAALKHHNPDRTAFTEKWNAEHGAYTANYCRLLHLKFWICQDIGSMHGPAFEHNATGDRATARWNEILSPMLFQFRGIAVACN